MELTEALERVLRSYEAYYTVERDAPLPPFAAQAEFRVHGEQYFLIKAAKYSEMDSREYVYFALEPSPAPERVTELARLAWEDGMAKVTPSSSHRNSDVLVLILAERLGDEAARAVKQTKYYKSYRMGLQGWSHFKLAAYETERGLAVHNRQGGDLAKLLQDIFKTRPA